MQSSTVRAVVGLLIATAGSTAAQAHEANGEGAAMVGNTAPVAADSHAPIGVMGDHMHDAGEWMVSYRYMNMEMEGNRNGTDRVSPEAIVSGSANPFAPPANLRVVPTEMTMEMHMLGAMYAPSDDVTLMAMLPYLENDMRHVTF